MLDWISSCNLSAVYSLGIKWMLTDFFPDAM